MFISFLNKIQGNAKISQKIDWMKKWNNNNNSVTTKYVVELEDKMIMKHLHSWMYSSTCTFHILYIQSTGKILNDDN